MINRKLLVIVTLLITTVFQANAQEIISVGPMVHFNIGSGKIKTSYGLEIAYWNYRHFPYSVDFGVEYERSKFRVYSEAQTGIAITGISAGPFLEFKKGSPLQAGVQGSFWINYILGLDCRFRFMKGKTISLQVFMPNIFGSTMTMMTTTTTEEAIGIGISFQLISLKSN